ncbi:YhcN/YlaJ family sporulation lipoprotein [Bacillus sp. V3B]|uniref:YhcN/YlaJ family sporulation lipoprotein n=1 Tax=Bacillus sp. V3B TaxID=2804915 RepID=UPI002108CBC9|nr:YhcN/YlaJ family sporulation lipoprotein [Bacillus sp. V3B]MCQ6273547.1 YhcN/YlaJ family sporulation lipoprotein [Bacillus sp. V3B]
MQQYRKLWMLSTIFIVGLTGCGQDDETAFQDKRTENTMPMGYYSNEEHESNGGNAVLLDGSDNDGPAVEIMDHTWGVERETNKRYLRVNNENNKQLINSHMVNNQMTNNTLRDILPDGVNTGDPTLGRSDVNYHGHMYMANQPTRQSYYNGYAGDYSKRITQATENVENVKEAQAFVDDEKVIIAVRLNDKMRVEETEKDIQEAVNPLLSGRTAQIVTNESQFNRIKVIDHDLRKGRSKEPLDKEMENVPQSNRNN